MLLTLAATITASSLALNVNEYDQWYARRFNFMKKEPLPYVYGWDVLPTSNISQMTEVSDGLVWAVVGNTLQQLDSDNNITPVKGVTTAGSDPPRILFSQKDNLLQLATSESYSQYSCTISALSTCTLQKTIKLTLPPITSFTSLTYRQSPGLLFGTSSGAYFLNPQNTTGTIITFGNITEKVLSMAVSSRVVAVGTEDKLHLYFVDADMWRFEYCESYVDNTNGMGWRTMDRTLWIASKTGVNVIEFDTSWGGYYIWRIGYLQGLPVANFTEVQISSCGRVWLGSTSGVVTFNSSLSEVLPSVVTSNQHSWNGVGQVSTERSPWRYLSEQRWLPFGPVMAMTVLMSGEAIIATTHGLSRIFWHPNYSLRQKAETFENITLQRHNRFGMVDDVTLTRPGDVTSFQYKPSDNDGLWTNIYLAAQCYRYRVNRSSEAKAAAWRSFTALERLYKVTPPERWGLMARSVVPRGTPTGSGQWHNSTTPGYENWTWKGDTSSDEVIGYFYALPLFHDYVCDNDADRDRVTRMLIGTTSYIMNNNWYLIDVTGRPTTWGIWNPSQLNHNATHYSERGLNSLEIITMLSVAYHYSGNQSFLEAIDHLGVGSGYFNNLVNWRIEYPQDQDYSDDELGFFALSAFSHVRESIPSAYAKYYDLAISRSWRLVAPHRTCLWTYMVQLWTGNVVAAVMDAADDELIQWSMEWIDWTVINTNRFDIVVDKEASRDGRIYSVDLLRQDERAMTQRWNGNVYQLDTAGQGQSEHDPSAFLLPYYLREFLLNKNR
eukprot:TRINITY_DN22196_c0_g1_i1.p1 TRINITY_DN22196_c0_g1~~TRINITY_DN22196_c0_g1_i1.p1  ORF type:complete len:800 (+),score=121.61 TRINITY_DN22196_c0_g1_i1:67-2400(+)